MNLKTSSGNRISGLLALMLFLIFSVCILGVLLSTADAYQRLNERNSLSGDRRTGMMFLSTKVRQYDRAEQVRVEDLAGAAALVLVCALAVGGLFALGNVTMNRVASAETGEAPVSVPTVENMKPMTPALV